MELKYPAERLSLADGSVLIIPYGIEIFVPVNRSGAGFLF